MDKETKELNESGHSVPVAERVARYVRDITRRDGQNTSM